MKTMGFRSDEMTAKDRLDKAIPEVDFQHVLIEGATGSGKTVSLILPILKDRLQAGHCIVFFDHKGHEHKKVKALAKEEGRLKMWWRLVNLMHRISIF